VVFEGSPKILTADASGEVCLWVPNGASQSLKQPGAVEATHFDMASHNNKTIFLLGYKSGAVELLGLDFPSPVYGAINEFSVNKPTNYPMLASCYFKIIQGALFVCLCKGYGSLGFFSFA